MTRAHVEFIQSQNVEWEDARTHGLRRNARLKRLSHDAGTGAMTALLRYRPGTGIGSAIRREGSEEFFVLDGSICLDAQTLGRHHYAFLPAGHCTGRLTSSSGALLLVFFNGGSEDLNADPCPSATDVEPALLVDAYRMTWDGTVLDPNLAHLRLSRKVLRAAPDGSCRTYLLAGLPHGRPADGRLALERHPHDEEMFLISGDMSCPQGVMRPGAYFYRPRGIVHGPHFSDHGFMMFMRNPGTNSIVTEWVGEARELPDTPDFQPVLPPGAPENWRRPYPPRAEF